jgi:hypothetical protein
MGVLFKSAIGLGAVYLAMFGPALKSADVGATASLCGNAAQARLAGDESLRAQLAAAGCVVKVAAESERLAKATALKVALPARVAQPSPPPPPAPKVRPGTLTESDLAEPWFGPAPRKSAKRG